MKKDVDFDLNSFGSIHTYSSLSQVSRARRMSLEKQVCVDDSREALKEKFRVGLYDENGKPRLSCARSYFLDVSLDFGELQDYHKTWRDFSEYLVLQRQEFDKEKGKVNKETIAVKCSKRGNDVYFSRLHKRLNHLKKMKDYTLFDSRSNIKETNCLLVTLTYDTKRASIQEAWENIGSDFNSYITNLRKKFGKASCVRVWESFFNGYPHIHALLIFHNYGFRTYRHNGKWRIKKKGEFENGYHSFVDVQAVRSLRSGLSYVTKYMMKAYGESYNSEVGLRKNLSDLTLAMCWIFRKQSFSVSRDFSDLIQTLHNSNHFEIFQYNLVGRKVLNRPVWVLIGVYSAGLLGIGEGGGWVERVDLNDFNICWNDEDRFATLIPK